jgi:hypothetical protein
VWGLMRLVEAVCSPAQSSLPRVDRVVAMQFEYRKASIVAGWVLMLAAIAVSLNVGSATSWLVLLGMGLLPPMMLFGVWRQPAQAMSESIVASSNDPASCSGHRSHR